MKKSKNEPTRPATDTVKQSIKRAREDQALQAAELQALTSAMPNNATKPNEFGRKNALLRL